MDYDGTLTPIVDRPELGVLGDETKEVLEKIADNPKFVLGVVSGRRLNGIKKIVGLDGIYYAGNHGLEASGPDFKYTHPHVKGVEDTIKRVSSELSKATKNIKGVLIENKGLSIVLHYRRVSKSDSEVVKEVFVNTVRPYLKKGKFKISENKMTLEFVPDVSWNKGDIVLKIIKICEKTRFLPKFEFGGFTGAFLTLAPIRENIFVIYVGDDKTDENVFKALENKRLTVVVGEKESNARYYVNNVDEVIKFLRYLASSSLVNKAVE